VQLKDFKVENRAILLLSNHASNHYMLRTGTNAPDFSLYASAEEKMSLSDFKGKKVILAFYPADWSPVCSDQIALYNETLPFFRKYNAEVVGISVDGRWCHLAFAESRKLDYPLLADFEPKGEVAKLYEAFNEVEGECERALYVIDENAIVRWSYLSPVGVNPGADGILDALEEMSQSKFVSSK
jgi:peroxiredoxin